MRLEEYENLDSIKQINQLARLIEKASEWYEVNETEGADLDIRETAKNLFNMGVREVKPITNKNDVLEKLNYLKNHTYGYSINDKTMGIDSGDFEELMSSLIEIINFYMK